MTRIAYLVIVCQRALTQMATVALVNATLSSLVICYDVVYVMSYNLHHILDVFYQPREESVYNVFTTIYFNLSPETVRVINDSIGET